MISGSGPTDQLWAFDPKSPQAATVRLVAFNATRSAATDHPLIVNLAPHGQLFSENLAATMGLPSVFLGWVAVQADTPVGVYHHRRTGTVGSVVPVHRQ